MWIRADGPYGKHKTDYRRFDVLLLVCGGIGITPMLGIPIVHPLNHIGLLKDAYLSQKGKESLVKKIYLVYSIREVAFASWFEEEFKAIQKKDGMPEFILSIHVTRWGRLDKLILCRSEDVPAPLIKGRPNLEAVFDKVIIENPNCSTLVYVCAPKKVLTTCWDLTSKKSKKGNRFHFIHEMFSL